MVESEAFWYIYVCYKTTFLMLTIKSSISILDSEEIRASQVEPVKPAKCSESSNLAHLSLVAGSWLFHDDDDDDANLWQLGLFAKIGRCVSRFMTIIKVVYVCNDNVAMFSSLAPIKIFRLNRATRRDACAIKAHNQVSCRSSPVYPGAPDRQN